MRTLIKIKSIAAVAALIFMLLAGLSSAFAQPQGGMALISRAESLRVAGELTAAEALYQQGLASFDTSIPEGARYAQMCRDGLETIQYMRMSYTLDENELNAELAKAYPAWVAAGGNAQKATRGLECLIIDGEPMYSEIVIPNLQYRNMDLMHADQAKNDLYASLVRAMVGNVANVWPKESWKTYDYPAT